MFRLIFLLLLATLSVSQECHCNAPITGLPTPSSLSNRVQQVTSVLLSLIPGTPAIPHQLAMVTGSMYEAILLSTGGKQITTASVNTSLSVEDFAGYAGYAALNLIFTNTNQSDKAAQLTTLMSEIGLSSVESRDQYGVPVARAVIQKFPINIPPSPYTSPNEPSTIPGDAQCETITDPDGWQPLCLGTPDSCTPQQFPFLPLVNASLISKDGEPEVEELISIIPPALTYDGDLEDLPLRGGDKFVGQFVKVLRASEKLNDRNKTVAEVFAPNAAIGVHGIALAEAAVRNLNVTDSAELMFWVSAAVRDGFIGSSTVKARDSNLRPITLIQCAFRDREIEAWLGPYQGTGLLTNTADTPWRPYLQTPPFPGYISGHTTVTAAGTLALSRFFNEDTPRAANCFVRAPGSSMREPRVVEGEEGYIEGVTDVPNSGPGSKGYVPAEETTICWNTWREYAKLVADSRLNGGVHTPQENFLGLRLGRRAAKRVGLYLRGRML